MLNIVKRNRKSKGKQTGANLVEMALMLPVSLILIYGLIYYSYILVIKGLVNSAAHSALEEATTKIEIEKIPLESDLPVNCGETSVVVNGEGSANQQSISKYCNAIFNLKKFAKDRVTEKFLGESYEDNTFAYLDQNDSERSKIAAVRVITPIIDGTKSSEIAYKEEPIVVEMDYVIRPIFPGLNPVKTTVRAAAFYEVQSALSFPVPVDCSGIPYGSENYNPDTCSCLKEGKGFNPDTGSCVECNNGRTPYIPGHPVYGELNDDNTGIKNGCRCPTASKCNDLYNDGNKGYSATSTYKDCGCYCDYGGGGFRPNVAGSRTGGCSCGEVSEGQTVKNSNGELEIGEKTYQNGYCVCNVKDPDSGENVPFTDALCQAIYPDIPAGRIQAHEKMCSCSCIAKRGDGCLGDTKVSYASSLTGGCECHCIDSNGHKNSSKEADENGICTCKKIRGEAEGVTCDETGDGFSTGAREYDDKCSCQCQADFNCGPNAGLDPDTCTCKCLSGIGSIDSSNPDANNCTIYTGSGNETG